jgi:hypothetical protein
VALADPHAAAQAAEAWTDGEVLAGSEGIVSLITEAGCDLVLNGIVGSAGLVPTVAALGEGVDLALANKESLVVGGELVTQLSEATGAAIIPVDSEHSALHQLLAAERPGTVVKLILTASGGLGRSGEDARRLRAQRAVQELDQLQHGYLVAGPRKAVAALDASLRAQDAGAAQRREQVLQELDGDVTAARQLGDRHRPGAPLTMQLHQRAQGIRRLGGDRDHCRSRC